MITLEKYIAGVINRGERQKLARILTYLKMGFGSAFVRGGGPTEASEYDEIPVDAFDPNSERYVYIFTVEDVVLIYQPIYKTWQVYNIANKKMDYLYNSTTSSIPGIVNKDMGVLYCAEITGEEGRETLKMDEKKLRIWINKVRSTVFKPINKTQRWWNSHIKKFDQIWSGSDLIYMQSVGHILLYMVDVKPDKSGVVTIYHMFGDDYGSVNRDGLKYDHLMRLMEKAREKMEPKFYDAVVNLIQLLDELW